jgi:glucoamylase
MDGTIFDRPPQTYERYVVQRTPARVAVWRRDHACGTIAAGQVLRIETSAPFELRWSDDGDVLLHAAQSSDAGLGRYLVDLPTADCIAGTRITFAIAGPGEAEGDTHAVTVVAQPPAAAPGASPARVR